MQEYYGDRRFYTDVLREPLQAWAEGENIRSPAKCDELFGRLVGARLRHRIRGDTATTLEADSE
jgi:hypothetical protein